LVTQPEDKSILHEIVRIVEARRRVPERVQVQTREYVITYLEDHRNRLEEALRRFDSDRLNILFGQLASKIKYQFTRDLPLRASALKSQAAKVAPSKKATAKKAATKATAKKVARKAAAKKAATKATTKVGSKKAASKKAVAKKVVAKKAVAKKARAKPAAKKHK